MAPLNVLSGGPSVGSVHPRGQARATCCRWREREVQLPQRARRVLPLSGRLARDRSCLWTADEHVEWRMRIAPIASGGARPSAWRKSIQREDPAHRHEFAFCFHNSSSAPWPIDKPIALPHVPRPSPCGKHFGFRSRWTAEEEMRKNRCYYTTETCVVAPNLAGLQHDRIG